MGEDVEDIFLFRGGSGVLAIVIDVRDGAECRCQGWGVEEEAGACDGGAGEEGEGEEEARLEGGGQGEGDGGGGGLEWEERDVGVVAGEEAGESVCMIYCVVVEMGI